MNFSANNRTFHAEKAFTMIEILSVVMIIAVLVVLIGVGVKSMIPALQSAQCFNNLRQISAGMIMYAGEHNGWLPASYTYKLEENGERGDPRGPWMMDLSMDNNYLPSYRDDANFKLWHCPSWRPFSPNEPYGRAPWLQTYAYVKAWNEVSKQYVSRNKLAKLTPQHPLIADSISLAKSDIPGRSYPQTYGVAACNSYEGSRLHVRHRGKVNIAFADGHCRGMTENELKEMRIDGDPVFWSSMPRSDLD